MIKGHIEDEFSTMIHEMAHIMAFNSYLFQFFVDPDTHITRGIANVQKTVTHRGLSSTMIITPKIKSLAQSYYNCPTAIGMFLENEGSDGSKGSHWDKSYILNECMISNSIKSPSWTAFTHALFEDSGWYKADYTYTQKIQFGKNRGCNFLDTTCYVNEVV